jgi:hypothetical protein
MKRRGGVLSLGRIKVADSHRESILEKFLKDCNLNQSKKQQSSVDIQ